MKESIQKIVDEINVWGAPYEISFELGTLESDSLYTEEVSEKVKEVFRNIYVLTVKYGIKEYFEVNLLGNRDRIIFTDATVDGDVVTFIDKYAGIKYILNMGVDQYSKGMNIGNIKYAVKWIDKADSVVCDIDEILDLSDDIDEIEEFERSPFNCGIDAIKDQYTPGLSFVFSPTYFNPFMGEIMDEEEHCKLEFLIDGEVCGDDFVLKTRLWDVHFMDDHEEFPKIEY